jgi:5S rRNA maturation endonuclease (ribonuclease M5)
MQFKRSRQVVTGLVTNTRVNVPKEGRKNVRAMVNNLLQTGSFYAPHSGVLSSTAAPGAASNGTLPQLNGALGHVGAVEYYSRYQTAKLSSSKAHLIGTSNDSLYRRFLMYTEFYACSQPVVICEGKTDNVYLTAAIRTLGVNSFPSLIGNGTLKIRFFKYDRVNTARRLGFVGGAGFLSTFIADYAKELLRISAPGMLNPVIILVDNDGAGKSILGAAKQASKNFLLNLQAPHIRIVGNLYLMAIPNVAGQTETVIEDLFPPAVLATTVAGKTLHLGKNFNPAIHYGKQAFAEHVVKPNASTINFDAFAPLLTNLSNLITLHV